MPFGCPRARSRGTRSVTDAETLLRPVQQDREERTSAEQVVAELLEDESSWPLEARIAAEAAEAHGISERTMRRTAARAGIRIRELASDPKGAGYGTAP